METRPRKRLIPPQSRKSIYTFFFKPYEIIRDGTIHPRIIHPWFESYVMLCFFSFFFRERIVRGRIVLPPEYIYMHR